MPTTSSTVEIGSPAPDFELPSTAGETVSLTDFAGRPALLVAFICNHCPYVRHVESELARVAADYAGQGLATVAISANDITTHPEDAPEQMAQQRTRAGFAFPYLYDESQDVARAYGAVCTPDLYLFDAGTRLVYHGQFDDTRPGRGTASGSDLRAAIEATLAGQSPSAEQQPSVGCSIKWKPGQAPDWA